jgi:hypothetical protein
MSCIFVGFEVLTGVTMKNMTFRVVRPCSSERDLTLPLASPSSLIDSLLDPEDGGDILLRNFGLSPNFAELQLKRLNYDFICGLFNVSLSVSDYI